MATIGVFAVIFDETERVLCVKANYGSGYWTTPGGRLEPGESPLQALHREVREESGYIINAGELIGVYAKPYRDDLVLSFAAEIVEREPWSPNEEIADLGFFDLQSLPDGISLVARSRIIDASEGRRGVFRVFESKDLED